MGYLTVSELRASPVAPVDPSETPSDPEAPEVTYTNPCVLEDIHDLDDEQIQYLIDYCTELINAYTGNDFNSYPEETRSFSGEDMNTLYIDRIYNIKSIMCLDDNNLVDKYRVSSNKRIIIGESLFNDGIENYSITGDWGYEEIPTVVKLCMYILINSNYSNLFDEDRIKSAGSPFKSEKIANYQYTKEDNNESNEDTTGNARVDYLLTPFKVDSYAIGVV